MSVWALMLTLAWWLWSAHTETLIIIFGVISIALVLFFFHRMEREAGDSYEYTLGLRPLLYFPYIVWEIITANFYVAKIIISPKMKISPKMFRTSASQKTEIGQAVYANSITLTPGTITLDVRDGQFLVHALTEETAEGVLSGDMDRRVTRLEGEN
jgi:multicomponent Na+:H+ antiporter subunit E